MKKTYVNPEIEIVRIETHKMLAESTTTVSFGSEQPAGNAQSRGFDFYDEDF